MAVHERCRGQRVRRTVAVLLLASVCIVGCGTARSTISYVAATDSSGVHILQFDLTHIPEAGTAQGPVWTVGSGRDSDSVALSDVRDVLYAGSSRVFIADGSTQEIVAVNTTSRATERIGGRGDGPAEFSNLTTLFKDSAGMVGAYDATRKRYTAFDSTGSIAEEHEYGDVAAPTESLWLFRSATAVYGVAVDVFPRRSNTGPTRGDATLISIRPISDTITTIPGPSVFSGNGSTGAVLFGATAAFSAARNGIWAADTGIPEVRFWSDGRLTRIIRWKAGDRTLTKDRKDLFWEAVARATPRDQLGMLQRMKAAAVFATEVPAFGSLIADSEGRLWIGAAVPPEIAYLRQRFPEQRWIVVDPDAATATRVTTPAGFTLLHVVDSSLIGVYRDSLDVETVRAYKLVESGAESTINHVHPSVVPMADPQQKFACKQVPNEDLVHVWTYNVPAGWSIEAAVYVTATARRRKFDGAPVDYIAMWVKDSTGRRAFDNPALWIYMGGQGILNTRPTEALPLNAEANEMADSAFGHPAYAMQPGWKAVRARDARAVTPPFSADDDEAHAALRCLGKSARHGR